MKKLEKSRKARNRREPVKNWGTTRGKYAIEPGEGLDAIILSCSDRSVLVQVQGKKTEVVVTGIPSNLGVDPKDLQVGKKVRVDIIHLTGSKPGKPWIDALGK